MRQQFAPPGMQPTGESPKESLPVSAPPATSFTKPMSARMSEPVSAGRREASRVTGPAETAAVAPSVPDVAIPQELRDAGIEVAPPDTIKIHDDIGAMLQNSSTPAPDPLGSTKEVSLPKPSIHTIIGVPATLNYLTGLERDEALERIKLLKKKEKGKSSKKFLITQVERQIKMKNAKDAGVVPVENSKEIVS